MIRTIWPWALLLVGACAVYPARQAVDPRIIGSVSAEAAAQVRKCYRAPRVPSASRFISTRLLVRYGRDGSLSGLPVVLSQGGLTPANRPWADKMAQAATLAVIRCSPVRLPLSLYEQGWNELELTFSPPARA
jgi:hypothetical protein